MERDHRGRQPVCLVVSVVCCVLIGLGWLDWRLGGGGAEGFGGALGFYVGLPLVALGTSIASLVRREKARALAALPLIGILLYVGCIVKALAALPIIGHP